MRLAHLSPNISIHLMFLLIAVSTSVASIICNFNTSHVSINPTGATDTAFDKNFNTSHVSINPSRSLVTWFASCYFNTSHVSINQGLSVG